MASPHIKHYGKFKNIALSVVVFLFLSFLTQLYSYQKYLLLKKDEKQLEIETANSIKTQLQNSLNYGLAATKTLAFIVEHYGIPKNFNNIAQSLTSSGKYIDAIELVEGGVITHIYPLKGNEEVLGYDVLKDTTRNKEALKALKRKELFFAGPFPLKQGGIGVVGREPIFIDNTFFGFAAVVIKLSTLIQATGIDFKDRKFNFQISKINPDTGQEEFFFSNVAHFEKTEGVSVNVPNGEWYLHVKLKNESTIAAILPLIMFGFLLSALGGFLIWNKLNEPYELSKKVDEKIYELNRLEKRYKIIIDNSLYPLFVGKPDGTILEANEAACELFGYTIEEFKQIGRQGITFENETLALAIKQREATKKSMGEFFGIKKNGQSFECEYSSILFKDDNGEEFTSVMVRDISQKKLEEKEKENLLNQVLESKNKFESLINTLEGIFWECNAQNYKFTYISPQVKSILGYSSEEWLSKPDFWQTHIHPDDRDTATAFCHLKTQQGEDHNFEYRMLALNGQIVWIRDLVKVISENGKAKTLRGLMIDITSLKKTEEENLLKEQKFKKLVQDGSDLIAILDINGNYKYVSPTSLTILNTAPEEYIGKNAFDFIHPDDKEIVIKSFSTLETEKRVSIPPFRFLHKNSSWRWIETTVTNLLDDPAVNGIVSNSRDITEKLLIEEQKEFEKRDKIALINNTSDLIWSVDKSLKLIAANDAFIESLYKSTGIRLKPGDSVMLKNHFPEDFLVFWETSYNYVLQGESFETEIRTPFPDNTIELWSAIKLNPVYKGGYISGVACYSRDISEAKKIEKEKQLILNINKIFNTEDLLQNVLPKLLMEILNYCSKKAAEIWVTTIDNNEMRLLSQNSRQDILINPEDVINFKIGEGLPGKIWHSREEMLIPDIANCDFFVRKNFATNNNLISCKGIPIIFKEQIIGVIVVYSDEITVNQDTFFNLNPGIISQLAIEIQRKKSEAELNLFFDLSPDLLCIAGTDGYFKKINPAFEKILGYKKDYILSTPFNDLIHPDDREITQDKVNNLFAGKSVNNYESRHLTADGHYIWLSWAAVPFSEENLIFAIGKDVTLRKKQEEEIYKKSEFIIDILESIGDAFFTLDKDFTVTYWNNIAETLLGISKENIVGQCLWDVFPDAKTLPSFFNYTKVLNEKITIHFEDFYEPVNKWLEISAYPSETGVSVYFKDITERKIFNQKMIELNERLLSRTKELSVSNAELEQFAYIASHDLQEPLRMITSFLTQLEKKYKDQLDEKAHQYIHFAVDGAKRMREIILDLLKYSRVGKSDLNKEAINLNEIIEDIKNLNVKIIKEKNAKFEIGHLPTIYAYKTPIYQIFQNLIDNALKYQKKEFAPLIKISYEENDSYWQFAVNDNGIGIEAEYFDKIFIIFQRLHAKGEYHGTGMGLAIVKKAVESLGGNIWLESSVNKGSTFYFTILKNISDENN